MRIRIAMAIACLGAFAIAQAGDVSAAIRKPTNIPAQTLRPALQQLSKERDLQLVFRTDVVGDLRTNGASGELTFDEALTELLKDTGLTYRYLDERTVTVVPAVDSSAKLEVGSNLSGNSRRCAGLSDGHLDLTTVLSKTGSKSTATGWNSESCERENNAGNLAIARAQEGQPVQANGESNLEEDSTAPKGIQEIVVTAQKREERLQDVPSSISVLSGERLEKTAPRSLVDLNGLVPGLTVNSSGPGRTQITLRGIAPLAVTGALVGTYIDETPAGSSTGQIRGAQYAPDLMPYDLERIEVLNGPQGTLYGAASMGGLLKYALKDPHLTQFSARVGGVLNSIDGSSGAGGGLRAAVNFPLVDNVFGLRVSGYDQKTQGYINNLRLNDRHYNSYTQRGGRLAGLWQVADTLSVKFSALIQKIDSDGPASVAVDATTLRPLFGEFARSTAVAEVFSQDAQLYSLVANWDLGFATLIGASSWEKNDTRDMEDLTPALGFLVPIFAGSQYADSTVPFPAKRTLDKFTQEIRLVSPSQQKFEWMVGAFYTTEDARNFQPVYALDANGELIPGINPFFAGDLPWDYEEIAAFANGTLRFNDRFALTAGVRYSRNEQRYTNNVYGALLGSITAPPPLEFPSTRENVTTWMVSPQWHVNSDTMMYARVATGYRPGGYAFSLPPAPAEYKSDTLTNYEIGIKSRLLEDRLVLSIALYHIEWTDIQQNVLDEATNLTYIGNGGDARSQGGEISLSYSFESDLNLGAVLGYTDAQLTEDAPLIGGVSGARIPGAKMTGALTADYQRAMGGGALFEAGASFRALGSTWVGVESAVTAHKISRAKPLDLYAGIDFGRIETRLFLRNAFNSTSEMDFVRTPAVLPPGALTLVPETPRTIGLSVDVIF